MYLTLEQAAKEAGKSKYAIAKAIQAEQLPAKKGEQGQWQIDPADLFQAFPQEEVPATSPASESPQKPLVYAQWINRWRRKFNGFGSNLRSKPRKLKHAIRNGNA